MKRNFLSLVLLFVTLAAVSQNETIAGKWAGTMTLNTLQPERIISFTVYFKQEGNAIWGIYANGDYSTLDSCDCAGKLTARLSKNNNSPILVYQDGIIEHNKIPLDLCTALNFFRAYYTKEGEEEFLKGKWFEVPENGWAFDGASGSFVLKKVNTNTDFDVDKYFPRLAQLIQKFNSR
jgi:hypothetical protein